jgi:NAD(P)-dependent dehydrogenase (short-subunit alcohol dehydrogenase family)
MVPSATDEITTLAEWDLNMNTNLQGTFLMCMQAIPHMTKTGSGSIVNVSSLAGINSYTRSLPYCVSKAGVLHLSKVLAAQYTNRGIRVNCIVPGSVDTPLFHTGLNSNNELGQRIERHPLKRLGKPQELASAVAFLASEDASWISGASLVVDGGMLATAY